MNSMITLHEDADAEDAELVTHDTWHENVIKIYC